MNYKCKTSFTSKTSKYYSYGDIISEQEYNSLPPNENSNFKSHRDTLQDDISDEIERHFEFKKITVD